MAPVKERRGLNVTTHSELWGDDFYKTPVARIFDVLGFTAIFFRGQSNTGVKAY